MSRRLTFLAVLAATVVGPASALASAPRASLTDVENEVMCVSCREPLAVAQSPQAYAERSFIRSLIAQGLTKPQIERQLVAQYGPAVLGRPPAQGFNLTVYVLPPALLVAGLIVLAVVLPRWRRRGRTDSDPASRPQPPLVNTLDARRLDDELSHWSG